MERMINNNYSGALMLVGGGIVGAGLALLFAPHSGRKTRRDIVRLGSAIGRKGRGTIHDLTRSVNAFADAMGDRTTAILREGKKLARAGKEGVLTTMAKGEETLGSRKRRLAKLFA